MIGRPSGRGLLLLGVAAVVALAVGAAVLVLDSPAEERRRRLDERRVQDLQEVAAAIDVYWTREGILPPDLDVLAGWQGLAVPRTDPATEEPYGYRVTGEATYELCAAFALETSDWEAGRPWRPHAPYWHHPAGEHCFSLEAEEVER